MMTKNVEGKKKLIARPEIVYGNVKYQKIVLLMIGAEIKLEYEIMNYLNS